MSDKKNTEFQLTGNNVPVNKMELIKHVHGLLYNYQIQINNNQEPETDPFKTSLIISNGDKTIMIPHEIQNEAIQSYVNNPQIFEYFSKLNNNDSGPAEVNSNKEKDEKDENEEKGESLYGIIFCIVFFFIIMQCAPRYWPND